MGNEMLLVHASALPDVFVKVMEAKRLIASGEAKTASEASRMCGISRSAYYKYKDCVFEYTRPLGEIVSLHAVLRDKAGVLSAFLLAVYSCGGNVLTVSQSLPVSGLASVSVSLRTPKEFDHGRMLENLANIDGVVSVKEIPGE